MQISKMIQPWTVSIASSVPAGQSATGGRKPEMTTPCDPPKPPPAFQDTSSHSSCHRDNKSSWKLNSWQSKGGRRNDSKERGEGQAYPGEEICVCCALGGGWDRSSWVLPGGTEGEQLRQCLHRAFRTFLPTTHSLLRLNKISYLFSHSDSGTPVGVGQQVPALDSTLPPQPLSRVGFPKNVRVCQGRRLGRWSGGLKDKLV